MKYYNKESNNENRYRYYKPYHCRPESIYRPAAKLNQLDKSILKSRPTASPVLKSNDSNKINDKRMTLIETDLVTEKMSRESINDSLDELKRLTFTTSSLVIKQEDLSLNEFLDTKSDQIIKNEFFIQFAKEFADKFSKKFINFFASQLINKQSV